MARSVGRPREPTLSRHVVIAAALDIIDNDGLAGLNIRALGDALGVNSASLYYHFANKEEILVGVAKLVLRRVEVRERPDEPWQAWMVNALAELRRALLSHPNAVPVIFELHPRAFSPEPYNVVVTLLESHGVPPELLLTIMDALEGLTIGSALSTIYANSLDFTELSDARNAGLRRMYEASRYDDEERFEMACYALIGGLTAQVAQHQAASKNAGPNRVRKTTTRRRRPSKGPR